MKDVPQIDTEYEVEIIPRRADSTRQTPISVVVNDPAVAGFIVFLDQVQFPLKVGTRCKIILKQVNRGGHSGVGELKRGSEA